MLKFYTLPLIALLATIPTGQSLSQDNFNIRYVGNALLSGSTYDVEIRDDLAYCTDKNGLTIYDLSNPENPIRIGQCHTPGLATKLTIQGDIAYIADISRGVAIVDISDPEAPRLVREFNLVMGAAWTHPIDVTVDDTILYICAGDDALYIADISDPIDPELLIHVGIQDPVFLDIIINGEIAYLLNSFGIGEEILILDVADPCDPRLISFFEIPFRSAAFAMQNDLLAVVSNNYDTGYLRLYSLENPIEPNELGHTEIVENSKQICLDGDYAYVSNKFDDVGQAWEKFQVVDISNPDSPQIIGEIEENGSEGMTSLDEYVYLSSRCEGLRVVSVQDPEEPIFINEPEQIYRTRGLTVEGGIAYVFDGGFGIRIVDISSPDRPNLIGNCELDDNYFGFRFVEIMKYGSYLYATNLIYLWIINAADPENPFVVKTEEIRGSARFIYMFIIDGYLYVIGRLHIPEIYNLLVYDLADPEEPELVYTYRHRDDDVWYASIDDDMLYMLTYDYVGERFGEHNVFVYSLDNPAEPDYRGNWGWYHYHDKLLVNNGYAYVYFSRDWNGRFVNRILTYSVENPRQPVAVDSFDIAERVLDMSLNEGRLYLHVEKYGFYCLSIEDPSHPEIVGYYDTPGCVNNIDSENGYLYVADEYELGIYRFEEAGMRPGIENAIRPSNFGIHAVYPNPFNSIVSVSYGLPDEANLTIRITDLSGREIATLFRGDQDAGYHNVIWDAGDVPSGTYLCRIQAGERIRTIKMVLIH